MGQGCIYPYAGRLKSARAGVLLVVFHLRIELDRNVPHVLEKLLVAPVRPRSLSGGMRGQVRHLLSETTHAISHRSLTWCERPYP